MARGEGRSARDAASRLALADCLGSRFSHEESGARGRRTSSGRFLAGAVHLPHRRPQPSRPLPLVLAGADGASAPTPASLGCGGPRGLPAGPEPPAPAPGVESDAQLRRAWGAAGASPPGRTGHRGRVGWSVRLTCVRIAGDSMEPTDGGALVVVDKDRRVAVDEQLFVVSIVEALVVKPSRAQTL